MMMGHNGGPPMMPKPDYEVKLNVEGGQFLLGPRSDPLEFHPTRATWARRSQWSDLENQAAQELFPDKADELEASMEDSSELSTNPDRENKFFAFEGGKQLIRLVDSWYPHKGAVLDHIHRVDHPRQRELPVRRKRQDHLPLHHVLLQRRPRRRSLRFVRNMQAAQDEYNARRSRHRSPQTPAD